MTRFELEVELSSEQLVGPLRISVNEGQLTDPGFVLAAALGRFLERPKNRVRPSIMITSFERTLEMLINNDLEIGFGYFFKMEHPSVEFLPLYVEVNQLYCGKGHTLFTASPQSLTWERIRQCKFVWRGDRIREHHPSVFAGSEIEIASSGMTPESRAYLILSGHYLGYLAEHQAARWVQAGMLRPLLPDCTRPGRHRAGRDQEEREVASACADVSGRLFSRGAGERRAAAGHIPGVMAKGGIGTGLAFESPITVLTPDRLHRPALHPTSTVDQRTPRQTS